MGDALRLWGLWLLVLGWGIFWKEMNYWFFLLGWVKLLGELWAGIMWRGWEMKYHVVRMWDPGDSCSNYWVPNLGFWRYFTFHIQSTWHKILFSFHLFAFFAHFINHTHVTTLYESLSSAVHDRSSNVCQLHFSGVLHHHSLEVRREWQKMWRLQNSKLDLLRKEFNYTW